MLQNLRLRFAKDDDRIFDVAGVADVASDLEECRQNIACGHLKKIMNDPVPEAGFLNAKVAP